ncbi:hypothetical protein ACH4E7_27360 [Kitasatospora sp. NPDC018058]|uniref:hypothetical protein n=1 Tax=Kitasatospora sp. NPDC018058 TaxID=3364025 RepID=UPI0037BF6EAC
MMINTALADLLDGGAATTDPERVLGALVDHGIHVPIREDGSVLFFRAEDGTPDLPGYISEACCAGHLPEAAGAVHCDVLRLLDIVEESGVGGLVLQSTRGWARVPAALLIRTAGERGRKSQGGEQLKLSWSTHPVAVALRDALTRRMREFPEVRKAWVSRARWLETGQEHLLVHIAVDEELPSQSADRLMRTLLAEEVKLGDDDPRVAMMALNTVQHAEAIEELEGFGLDTVRVDRVTGRMEVLSREYDDPEAAEAARRALDLADAEAGAESTPEAPKRPRRWWRRS